MAKVSLNLGLVFAFLALQVGAAPLHRRQTGSAECNAARLQTVSGLTATTKAVDQLASASTNDEITSSAVAQAKEGLSDAQEGINTIAQALSSGQDASADARTQVGDGLESAQSALQAIQSTDPAVASGVQDAMAQLAKTAQAGEQVVSLCGGGGAASLGPQGPGGAAAPPPPPAGSAPRPPPPAPPAGGRGKRQIGSAECNAARLQTVSGLTATTKAVDQLASASANDEITSSAVAQAKEGLSDAQGGIQTIAQAIVSGQDAPADARTQVGDGLESAQSALQAIQSTDPAVTSGVQDAMAQLAKTAQAGKQVVSSCGGGGAASLGRRGPGGAAAPPPPPAGSAPPPPPAPPAGGAIGKGKRHDSE
ncbi:hypothetical protein PM082_019184 [Marasmius tenuissimus]|nr:hypothetical protein PM082_019184 [Marasmius tenuissimus]